MKKKLVLIGIPVLLVIGLLVARFLLSDDEESKEVPALAVPETDSVNVPVAKSKTEVYEHLIEEEQGKRERAAEREVVSLNMDFMKQTEKSEKPKGGEQSEEPEATTAPKSTVERAPIARTAPEEVSVDRVRSEPAAVKKPSKPKDPFDNLFNTWRADDGKSAASDNGGGGTIEGGSDAVLPAVIHGDQKIANGSAVLFRTTKDVRIGGQLIKKNTIFTGTASLSGERINISLSKIRTGGTVVNTNLTCYDNDQLPGVKVSNGGKVLKEEGNDVADEVLQSIPLGRIITRGRRLISNGRNGNNVFLMDGHRVTFMQ